MRKRRPASAFILLGTAKKPNVLPFVLAWEVGNQLGKFAPAPVELSMDEEASAKGIFIKEGSVIIRGLGKLPRFFLVTMRLALIYNLLSQSQAWPNAKCFSSVAISLKNSCKTLVSCQSLGNLQLYKTIQRFTKRLVHRCENFLPAPAFNCSAWVLLSKT